MESNPISFLEQQPTSQQQTNELNTEVPVSKDSNKKKKLLITILVFLLVISLGVAGYFYYQNLQLKKEQETPAQTIPTPTSILPPTMIIPTDNLITYGTVEGKICYPSDFIPEGYILAKNVETEKVEKIYFEGVPPKGQEYSLKLKPGKYVFAYEIAGNPNGFYTPCALTGNINNCSTPESHQLIEVNVPAGEIVKNIDLCDQYYQPEEKPNF